ncbi:hypothetical protein N8622_01180, partial [bacterium]|nr:hypothetical protein [bacterium]
MKRIFVVLVFTGIASSIFADNSLNILQSTFKAYCIKCHGKGGKIKGKVNLLELKSADDLLAKPELLETLLTVLKDREMPPKDEPLLPTDKRKHMIAELNRMLSKVAK